MSDKLIQDRDGAGKEIVSTLTDKVGTDGFRTAIIKDGDTTTMLRTKGGMPEVTVSKSVASSCKLFPLVERDEDGESTQAARVYYHDHEIDDEVPERRIYTSDGLFSIVAKPTRRVRFKSAGLGRPLDVWFNDHSVPNDEKNQLATVSFTQGKVTDEEKTNDVFKLAPIQSVEQLKRSPTAQVETYKADELAFDDDPEARLWRRYYPPIFVNQDSPPAEGDDSTLNGMAFLISRVKRMVFKVSGMGQHNGLYRAFFGRYNNNVTAEVAASDASGGLSERKISKRVFDGDVDNTPLMQKMEMQGGKISLAAPGGLFHPVRLDQWSTLDPMERTRKADGSIEFLRLSSLSNVVTFGQPWHGLYSNVTRTLRSITTDEVIKTFDEADTSAIDDSLLYVNFGAEDLKLPANTVFSTDAEKDNVKFKGGAVFYNGRYSLLPGNITRLDAGVTVAGVFQDFLIKNSDGKVFRIRASTGQGLLIITIRMRFDTSFLASVQETDTVLYEGNPNPSPKTDPLSYGSNESYGNPYLLRISPDGRKLFACGATVEIVGDIEAGASIVLKGGVTPIYKSFRDDAYATRARGTGSPYQLKTYDTFYNGVPVSGANINYGVFYHDALPVSLEGGTGSWSYSWDIQQTTINHPPANGQPGYSESSGSNTLTCSIDHTITTKTTSTHSELIDAIYDTSSGTFTPVEQLLVRTFVTTERNTVNHNYNDTWSGVINDVQRAYHLTESTEATRHYGDVDSNEVTLYVGGAPCGGASAGGRINSRTVTVDVGFYVTVTPLPHGPYEPGGDVSGERQLGRAQVPTSDVSSASGSDILGVSFGVGAIIDGPDTPYDAFSQQYIGNSINAPYIYRPVYWRVTGGNDVYSYAGNAIYHGKQAVTITPGQWVHIDPATEEIGVNNHQACVII